MSLNKIKNHIKIDLKILSKLATYFHGNFFNKVSGVWIIKRNVAG